ncbi:hypothetical protein [Flavobacterium geliluteum]|uniref:SprB repeat-containing protein n=1 Tax=Flavobacterium geliluteum TaxID=2816120 RepID=A0A940X7W1_9FLAO|nr:hypothetical protein [Flavobacterium geliluteum]MBP4137970.1 hypothetical protein [Flavobacterium geliluteum]
MKKQLLFFIFFLGNLLAHGQSEYGILVISTLSPSVGWDGSHAGSMRLSIGGTVITKGVNTGSETEIEYDFFYVTDNPSTIEYYSSTAGNKNGTDCKLSKSTTYDKDSFARDYFGGCIGDFEVISLHIPDPEDTNQKCIEDVITLKNGWNWQYKYDNSSWTPFAAQFQDKASISFKIKDLGYSGQSKIYFQSGYKTNFTNTMPYDIIPCSSNLISTSNPNYTLCNYSNGDVTFTFSRPLEPGENYLFTRNPVGSNIVTSANSNDADKVEKISATTFKWKNIPPGNYEFKFQNQFENNTPSTLSPVTYFTITARQKVTFTTMPVQPNCSTDSGGILITAAGGTPPYFYILDNQTKKELTTNPYTIPMLSEGIHNVIVIDSNNCIEN